MSYLLGTSFFPATILPNKSAFLLPQPPSCVYGTLVTNVVRFFNSSMARWLDFLSTAEYLKTPTQASIEQSRVQYRTFFFLPPDFLDIVRPHCLRQLMKNPPVKPSSRFGWFSQIFPVDFFFIKSDSPQHSRLYGDANLTLWVVCCYPPQSFSLSRAVFLTMA